MDSKKETEDQQYAVMPEGLRAAIARIKGQEAMQEAVHVPVEQAFPVTARISAKANAENVLSDRFKTIKSEIEQIEKEKAEKAARKRAEEEAIRQEQEDNARRLAEEQKAARRANPQPGDYFDDRGIFIKQYTVTDKNGLTKVFNAYASKEDLKAPYGKPTNRMDYDDVVKRMVKLGNGKYKDEKELHEALLSGEYKEGTWVIPPAELLREMYALRHTSSLQGTFNEYEAVQSGLYWSSTRTKAGLIKHEQTVINFADGSEDKVSSGDYRARPVHFFPA